MSTAWSKDPFLRASAARQTRASSLRHAATEPERKLWRSLRQHLPLQGTHFRRQVPINRYIVDFCCHAAKLVIEVDGDQHGRPENIEHDERRTEYLETRGYRVLRFSNRDVMTRMDVVLDTIDAALCGPTPTPNPSPQGGGE